MTFTFQCTLHKGSPVTVTLVGLHSLVSRLLAGTVVPRAYWAMGTEPRCPPGIVESLPRTPCPDVRCKHKCTRLWGKGHSSFFVVG